MRRTRFAGLNSAAKDLVAGAASAETVGSLSAVWQPLKRYTMPDGSKYTEFLQDIVESISQVYFLALKDADGNDLADTLWTEAEMKTW